MPIYDVQAPDGRVYSVEAPEGTSQDQIFAFVSSQMGQSNAPKPQEGIGAALTGGFKRFLSSGETALESLINPELAAQRGAERSERIGAQYAPGASLEKVKQVYEQQGLFPAAKEVISQIPSALAEQAPNIAATLASARTGAMVGAPFGGPIGALAGGVAGAALPSLVQLYGANLERQFEEKTPEISRASAFGAAVPGAALEVASQFIPLGRGWLGKLLGPTAEKALARGSDAAVERAAKESLASSLATGTITGSLAEIPTEVAQQMLERYQAGLSLTDEAAQKEYGEAAYGAALVGGPFGAAARGLGRPGARAEFEKRQQEEQARLAVTEEELAQRFPEGTLPGGFRIDREEVGREIGPAGFSIMAEGREEPIAVVDTQEEADAKLESLTKIRQEEAEKLLAEEQKINAEVEKTKARLEQLEATEQTDTEEYKSLKAGLPAMMEDSAQRVSELYNKVESLSKPLTAAPFGETERVNEQFNVFDQAGKAVGTYKTLGEAEASIKDVVGSEEFDRKIQAQETAKQLYKAFVPQMRKFGLGDVGLNIVDQIENGAGGAYLNKLIKVSLEEEAPLQAMRHESLHALKDLGFFTPQQWKALEERAKKEWIEDLKKVQYSEGKTRHDAYIDLFTQEGKDKGFDGKELDQYVNDSLIEEAIADAFGAYDKGVKPPPGLIAALYRKLKNFFANLGQALRGAGFQSADDIFQQIERGELKAAPAAKPAAAEKASLKRPAVEGEIEISTQNPSGPKRAYDPIAQMLSIDEKAVMEAMKSNPDYRTATIKAIKSYGFIPEGVKDKDVIELFKNNIVDNLLYLYNLVPEDIRKRSKLWYDGANKIAEEMADKYGLSLRQVSAIMAAMSPQKDWFQNVSMGERAIDILTKHGDRSWTPEMLQYAESYVKETKDRAEREKRQEAFEKIKQVAARGTTLNNMDIKSAAAFIRAYDEAFHSRQYRIVTPEGGFGNNVVNDDGTPSTLMWSTYSPIEKAVSIYRDGSRENVSEQLGFEHKIRSFYNNIAAPNSDLEHVTIDTHAVAAALFESLAGTDPEVVQNFGGTGKTKITGVGGTYGLIAEAYREAAKKVGVLPREMQSITWEAVRGLFSQEIKNAIKNPVKAEWAKYKSGELSFEQARKNIIDISRNKRSNNKNVDIPPPDWVGSGDGQFVEDGGESYDKSYAPAGGVRLREEQEIREKLTFNLSAVTNSIPGLRELYARALKRDEKAVEVLQGVADASLTHLLSGTNARVKITRAKGVYLSDREPSLMVAASFNESEAKDVLAALARFAKNFNQEQIHVRMPTKKKVGFEYGDGSYVTPVYTIPLKKQLNNKAISDIIDKSGLKGFTVTDESLITYFVRPNKEDGESNAQYATRVSKEFEQFEEEVASAHVLAGKPGTKVGRKAERLFVYGSGYGAAIDYESIGGDVRPKQASDTITPKLIAEYLTGKPVQVFKQKDLTKAQVAQQEKLAEVFDSLPVNDLKNPLVKKAYKALTKALKEQFAVLPVKVEIQTQTDKDGNIVPPYNNNSAEMRRDILERNHILVYPTTPETFGPEGYDFSGHPLLEDSGFKDINGTKMLFNDVLRAVHDYFAHGMSEAQFGPKGEFTAWRNHMASTPDPMARWALTAETRMQNAWQNFSEGAQNIPLKDRPFALQKAALPPTEFLYTGDNAVDLATFQMERELSDKDKRGSQPTAKLSLGKAPTSPEFKQWFGKSKITKDGEPKFMYHGLAKDTTDFTRKTARGAPIFLTDDPEFAAKFAADSYEQVAKHPEEYLTDKQIKEGVKKAISAIKKDYRGGKDTLGKEMIDSLSTGDIKDATFEAQEYLQNEYMKMLPAGPHIMRLYVRAERPFDYENPEHVRMIKAIANLDEEAMAELGETPASFWKGVAEGDWPRIEADAVQNAIKEYFDSFYVKELGRKNLAVYQPNQVKSATGNIGTYDLKNPDVRYSLRGVAFPTVKEAREAAEQQPVPDTAEFKQYIAGSQWLDEDGKAKKFFHATTGDFFEFRDGAVYLSETAEESEKWGRLAEDRLREKIYKALNKSEKLPVFQQAVDQAVEAGKITEAEGVEFMRDVKRSVPDFGKYDAIKSEMDDALLALSPSRMKIMPLYARAMNPFDFRNKEHVEQVVDYITRRQEFDRSVGAVAKEINEKIGGAPTTNTENILKGLKGLLVQGYEKTIVDPMVQHAIRRLNFDGYLVRRNRQSPISYAIYQPKQLKSITGNDGQFSLETNDIRYSLRRAAYTPQRIDRLIDQFAYTQNDAENDTKAYIARVNPRDFLRATTTYDGLDRIRSEAEPLDVERLMKEGQPIYLSVREGKFAGADVWEIRGHEGRHRMMALADAGYDSVPVVFDFGQRIRNAQPTGNKYIVRQNFGGDIGKAIQDFSIDNAIPVSYGQKDALRQFEKTDGIKFSLPSISAADRARMNRVAPQRYTPGWKERVVGAFKQDFTQLRQQFLNRYESLAVYDRMLREMIRKSGGPELLADQSAEFAALQSDLSAGVAASAMGIGDRQGGVPVYRNGVTTIDTSVKGLTEALAPLAKYGDPEIYQRYQFWAGWKRGRRLLAEGKERLYETADAAIAARYEKMHPEFIQVQKDLIAFNDGIVNFAVQTGVLSKERARVYTQYADYIPFYRQFELDKTIGPNPFSGISGVKGPKAIKGGESPLGDFMENMVRNTQSLINAGMKNVAAQRATDVAMRLNMGLVQRLPGPVTGVGVDAYTVLENGQLVYYRSADPLFIQSLASLNMPDLPFMGLLSTPANALRNLVTKDPGFMFANLLRDSLSAYVTSGQNITPIVGTMVNFGKALSGKDKNLQALFNAGVIGGYEFSQNIQQSGKSLTADLNKKAGTDATLLRPFKSLWEGLEKGTTASDAATRMAVYERVMKETNGNEAEAISRALEVMNFNRKGSNVLIRVATAALPFFNARLQGLDLFYRASTGRMDTADAQEIKRKFWVRGLTMAGLSAMYYMSVAGDDEYEKQEEETKDNNWIFPSLGIRIPIPFEVGTLFKTVPERITAYIMGNDTGKDLKESSIRALANTFAFNPIPQTFKPLIEVATNYNFFTMRSIVGQGMQDVAPQFQVGPGTSKTAEWIGGKLGLSPMKIDQLIKGYTGTIGGYVIDVVDAMANEFADVPKASKRFEQMPIIKRFMLDPEARGSVTQFYELQKSVDTFVRTANLLEKTARPEEYAKYVQENIGMLAAKDYVQETEKVMKDLSDMKRTVNSLGMPPDEKRDLILDIGRAETHLTANIKTIKKAVSELK